MAQEYFGGPLTTQVESSDPAVTVELRGGPTETGPMTLSFTVGNDAVPVIPEEPVALPATAVAPAAKPIVNGCPPPCCGTRPEAPAPAPAPGRVPHPSPDLGAPMSFFTTPRRAAVVFMAGCAALLALSACASPAPLDAAPQETAKPTTSATSSAPACDFPTADKATLPILDASTRLPSALAAPEGITSSSKVTISIESVVFDQQLQPIGVLPHALPWEPSTPLVLPVLDVPIPCAGVTAVLLPAGTDAGPSAIGLIPTVNTTPAAGEIHTATIDTVASALTVKDSVGVVLL